jgi:predicted ATPase
MLLDLSFNNFKAWESARLDFGLVTGLFGANSSGKTTLLQFLLLLKQTKEATDRGLSLELNGNYVNLGLFSDMIFDHDQARSIDWSLSFRQENALEIFDPAAKKRSQPLVASNLVAVRGSVSGARGAPEARRLEYRVGSKQSETGEQIISLALRDKGDGFELKSSGNQFQFSRTQGRAWPLPGPVKSYAFPDQARTYHQNASFLSDLEASLEAALDNIYYLGPLRDYPQRDYLWARSRPQDVGKKGEKAIDAILAATAAGERRNTKFRGKLKSFQEVIAFWLTEMGLIDSFEVKEIAQGSNRWQALVRVRKDGPEALLTEVGFGVSQVLPVITLLYYVPENSTVLLEQPEIHLHPLAQAQLADVIINVAQRRNVQVVLESHSEHLLLRLQRRIAEQEIDAGKVKLYFCQPLGAGSKLSSLDLDLFGNIGNWPENFMGDAFGETAAAEKARLKRLKAAE